MDKGRDVDLRLSTGARRRYHTKCVSDWLQRSTTCPTCNLDLAEHGGGGSNEDRVVVDVFPRGDDAT